MIKEVIVVEGKDDLAAVKRACTAEVIITNGLGLTQETIDIIKTAQKRCGVVVLTDPDAPGEKIRHIIDQAVPGCGHAYLQQRQEKKGGKPFGVEDASPEEIRAALSRVRLTERKSAKRYLMKDLYEYRLAGDEKSSFRRHQLAKALGIGRPNSKQLLNRLNAYGISRDEFEAALIKIGGE